MWGITQELNVESQRIITAYTRSLTLFQSVLGSLLGYTTGKLICASNIIDESVRYCGRFTFVLLLLSELSGSDKRRPLIFVILSSCFNLHWSICLALTNKAKRFSLRMFYWYVNAYEKAQKEWSCGQLGLNLPEQPVYIRPVTVRVHLTPHGHLCLWECQRVLGLLGNLMYKGRKPRHQQTCLYFSAHNTTVFTFCINQQFSQTGYLEWVTVSTLFQRISYLIWPRIYPVCLLTLIFLWLLFATTIQDILSSGIHDTVYCTYKALGKTLVCQEAKSIYIVYILYTI